MGYGVKTERELERYLLENPDEIISGVDIIAAWNQIRLPHGRLDILLLAEMDELGPVCYVVELKKGPITNSAVCQVLRYVYDLAMVLEDAENLTPHNNPTPGSEGFDAFVAAYQDFWGGPITYRIQPILVGASCSPDLIAACGAANIDVLVYSSEAEGISVRYVTIDETFTRCGPHVLEIAQEHMWARQIGSLFSAFIQKMYRSATVQADKRG